MCSLNSTHRRRGNLAALVSGSALTAVQVVFDARLLSVRCDTMVIGCCLMHWHSEVAFADGSVVRLENEAAIQEAREIIKIKNLAREGDTIVVVAGMPFGISGSTNSIRVVEI